MPKSHKEKVVSKVGKRPQTASQIGQKLGYPDHRGVSRALSDAVQQGQVVKTQDGRYQSA